jgi:hypothetical protein
MEETEVQEERNKESTLAFQALSSKQLRDARLRSRRKIRFACRKVVRVVGGRESEKRRRKIAEMRR